MYQVKIKNRDKTLEERISEIQSQVDSYKAAQEYQSEHGGPGPVADYEIMAIVNEHEGNFEVILPEILVEE